MAVIYVVGFAGRTFMLFQLFNTGTTTGHVNNRTLLGSWVEQPVETCRLPLETPTIHITLPLLPCPHQNTQSDTTGLNQYMRSHTGRSGALKTRLF